MFPLISSAHKINQTVVIGRLGWCCWDNGCLLLLSIKVLRKELKVLTAFSQKHREVCKICQPLSPHSDMPIDTVTGTRAVLLLLVWSSQEDLQSKGL